jgi:glucose/mannose-6-phosphate isomerase
MLDDENVLRQRDPENALGVAAAQFEQAQLPMEVANPEHDARDITRVVVAGMGGSALAALLIKSALSDELMVPFEVVREYDLPEYVDFNTLVIASSHSGNTEETLNALGQAQEKNAQIAVVTSGGKLLEKAKAESMSYVQLPAGLQPRMGMIHNLRALTALLAHFGVIGFERFAQIAEQAAWLAEETKNWTPDVTVDKNYAKQLALLAVGKTPVFYGGPLMAPVAYKWKISWNENAKNVAFWNEYPEFNHNEFVGWASHPVEKPFVVFDLVSNFENPRVLRRFEISDRLLSGMRPKATTITLKGDRLIAQYLWGCILADFVSIYVAILNGVDPTPVALVEKLKKELAQDQAAFTSPDRHEGI